MEARLLYASKVPTINPQKREWRIINPLKFGIRVDPSQIPEKYTKFFNADISPDISHFLTDLAGEGGPWEGWTLYAVGDLMYMKDARDPVYTMDSRDPMPYFQVVFVRRESVGEESAARESGGAGFERFRGREGLKSEDFPVVSGGFSPIARRR